MNRLDEEIARNFKTQVEAAIGAHLCELRVFGSRARGDAREDSDLDIFVMVDEDSPAVRHAVYGASWQVAYDFELPYNLSPLVMSRRHYQELLRRERLIARDVRDQGIPL